MTTRGKLAWWQYVAVITLTALVYVQMAGWVSPRVLVPRVEWSADGIEPAGEKADTLEGRFARWDSGYYLQIARNGYQPGGDERAFFPLYPALIRLARSITGLSFLWTGWILSILCLGVASLILYQWVLIDHDPRTAKWSVAWLCFFPMAFFFSAIYAEALFLLASLAAVYFARRGQFVISGLAIAVAGATRLPAFLLGIFYVAEFWLQHDFRRTRCLRFGAGALIAPLGTLAYLLFLFSLVGTTDLSAAYVSVHLNVWKQSVVWPWVTLYDGLNAALFGANIQADWFSRAEVWQDLMYALLGLACAVWAFFHVRRSTAVFLLGSMLFLYSNHGPYGYAFMAMPRWVAALFPIYPVLARQTLKLSSRYRWLLLAGSIGLLGLLSAWFVSGRWVA
jgi:hypothetical protein